MRILITGAGGTLGSDVRSAATAAGLDAVAFDHGALDVSDVDAVAKAVGDVCPDAVVNCAAWTDVDGAESRIEEALAANRDGAANLARTAAAAGSWTVHVSTDYVFDGERGPYSEDDVPNPRGVYARTKTARAYKVQGTHTALTTSLAS